MWCSNCRQEVPGIPASDGRSGMVCARCDNPVQVSPWSADSTADSAADSTAESSRGDTARPRIMEPQGPPIDPNDWQFDDDLRSAELLAESAGQQKPTPFEPSALDFARAGAAFEPADEPHPTAPPSIHTSVARRPRRRGSWISWALLSSGSMALVCGVVLLVWSCVADRAELWNLGIAPTMAGQAALLIGLVFQLENLWRTNRETTGTLAEMDQRLSDLRHATTLLTTTHSNPAQSFYAHMADGATPHLLLADLKGQLDLLATKLSK